MVSNEEWSELQSAIDADRRKASEMLLHYHVGQVGEGRQEILQASPDRGRHRQAAGHVRRCQAERAVYPR